MRWADRFLDCITALKSPNREPIAKFKDVGPRSKISAPVNISASPANATRSFLTPDGDGNSMTATAEVENDLLQIPDGAQPVCQIMSDLHLEWRGYEQFQIVRAAPILLLVGDIGRFCDYDRLLGFLQRQCEIFDRVLLVPGNHEFYGSSRQKGLELGEKLEQDLGGKFHLMHRGRVNLDNGEVVILGCTLHSRIPDNFTALTNDFNKIEGWRVLHHNEEHLADIEWLQRGLAEIESSSPRNRVIIATHYAPAFERTVEPAHEGSNLRHCFCSNALEQLCDWTGANLVSHWVYGHTHYNARFRSKDVIVVSNQPSGPFSHRSSGWPFDPKLLV